MSGAELVLHVWKEWGVHALVLLSFAVQVTLLILAEYRRFIDSGVLRFFIWSAYMLADGTAIYVLGHMAATSRSPEHQLVAFWAPFLLMHLGGQDNITAYAIEDNRLWLRHLQTLVVQVAAASYVLYESSIVGSPLFLRCATILMFVVGVVKYGERVWALKWASSRPKGKNYRTFQAYCKAYSCSYYLDEIVAAGPWDSEAYLLMAQRMVDVPKDLLKGPLPNENGYYFDFHREGHLYKVVEMQLSLMHDIFYTKTEMMHMSWCGLCIRMISLVATTAALFLFHLLIILGDHHHKDMNGYNKDDVAVTYVLLVGATVLEVTSLLRTMFSSWTSNLLIRWSRDNIGMKEHNPCNSLARIFTSLRRLVHAADWRRRCSWSRLMRQHNLFQLGTGSRISRRSKIAKWMGAEDWWNTKAYSWSIPVSAFIEKLLVDHVLASDRGHPFNSIGQAKLKEWGLYGGLGRHDAEDLAWSMEERIVVWHIATNIYLSWWDNKQPAAAEKKKAEAVEALSNYMMFLLAARPYMLPPTSSRTAYVEICYALTAGGLKYSSAKDLASKLRSYGGASKNDCVTYLRQYGSTIDFGTQSHLRLILQASCGLGTKLISSTEDSQDDEDDNELELLAQVWVETLCYAAKGCSGYSHAKQLSNGGELITVAAILLEYMAQGHIVKEQDRPSPPRDQEFIPAPSQSQIAYHIDWINKVIANH
ncbi:unnamed protein product [Urochloa humidicola]